jgi:hypothetical protein
VSEDCKNSFYRVVRFKLWEMLKNNAFPYQLVNTAESVYQNTRYTGNERRKVGMLTTEISRYVTTRAPTFTHSFRPSFGLGHYK